MNELPFEETAAIVQDPEMSTITPQDARIVAYAIGKTFRSLLDGVLPLTEDSINRLLGFWVNPWLTSGSIAFFKELDRGLHAEQVEI